MKLPQLSLRELFLLVVIAAMGCGWWVDKSTERTKRAAWEDELREQLQRRGGVLIIEDGHPYVGYTWEASS